MKYERAGLPRLGRVDDRSRCDLERPRPNLDATRDSAAHQSAARPNRNADLDSADVRRCAEPQRRQSRSARRCPRAPVTARPQLQVRGSPCVPQVQPQLHRCALHHDLRCLDAGRCTGGCCRWADCGCQRHSEDEGREGRNTTNAAPQRGGNGLADLTGHCATLGSGSDQAIRHPSISAGSPRPRTTTRKS